MDFCKNNWAKIAIAVLSLTGLILMLVNIFTIGDSTIGNPSFMNFAIYIGIAMFFAGILAYLICTMFGVCKCARAWILIATGLIVSLFITFTLIREISNYRDAAINLIPLRFTLFPIIVQLIVFGLFPFTWGIKQLARRSKGKVVEA